MIKLLKSKIISRNEIPSVLISDTIELSEFQITFAPRTTIKGWMLADFIV